MPLATPLADEGEVLVVEDDLGFARLLEAELAHHGLSAVLVSNAEAAMARLETVRPRAMLLDLLLPGQAEHALLERARQSNGDGVPTVIVTVKDLDLAGMRALEHLGAAAVVRKESNAATRAAALVARLLARDEPAVNGCAA
ncbi:MAG: response regulator transcription factor [Chloroflexi bacterium]|nr:response regulator transcription factor [Chloroflexota bacterium]